MNIFEGFEESDPEETANKLGIKKGDILGVLEKETISEEENNWTNNIRLEYLVEGMKVRSKENGEVGVLGLLNDRNIRVDMEEGPSRTLAFDPMEESIKKMKEYYDIYGPELDSQFQHIINFGTDEKAKKNFGIPEHVVNCDFMWVDGDSYSDILEPNMKVKDIGGSVCRIKKISKEIIEIYERPSSKDYISLSHQSFEDEGYEIYLPDLAFGGNQVESKIMNEIRYWQNINEAINDGLWPFQVGMRVRSAFHEQVGQIYQDIPNMGIVMIQRPDGNITCQRDHDMVLMEEMFPNPKRNRLYEDIWINAGFYKNKAEIKKIKIGTRIKAHDDREKIGTIEYYDGDKKVLIVKREDGETEVNENDLLYTFDYMTLGNIATKLKRQMNKKTPKKGRVYK